MERLDPYIKANPDEQWKVLVEKAYLDRVNLSSTGFFKLVYALTVTNNKKWNWKESPEKQKCASYFSWSNVDNLCSSDVIRVYATKLGIVAYKLWGRSVT